MGNRITLLSLLLLRKVHQSIADINTTEKANDHLFFDRSPE